MKLSINTKIIKMEMVNRSLLLGVVVGGTVSNVRMPDGIRRDQFLAWVEQLEDRTTPDWLGLPNNAERVLLANRGKVQCWSTPGPRTFGARAAHKSGGFLTLVRLYTFQSYFTSVVDQHSFFGRAGHATISSRQCDHVIRP